MNRIRFFTDTYTEDQLISIPPLLFSNKHRKVLYGTNAVRFNVPRRQWQKVVTFIIPVIILFFIFGEFVLNSKNKTISGAAPILFFGGFLPIAYFLFHLLNQRRISIEIDSSSLTLKKMFLWQRSTSPHRIPIANIQESNIKWSANQLNAEKNIILYCLEIPAGDDLFILDNITLNQLAMDDLVQDIQQSLSAIKQNKPLEASAISTHSENLIPASFTETSTSPDEPPLPKPVTSRIQKSLKDGNNVVFALPPERNMKVFLYLGFILLWIFGIFKISGDFKKFNWLSFQIIFVIVGLLGLINTIGGMFATFSRTVLRLTPKELVVTKRLLGIAWNRRFPLTSIKGVRLVSPTLEESQETPVKLIILKGNKLISIGAHLEADDKKWLAQEINNHLAYYRRWS